MANELAEKRFCSNEISYLRDYLVSQQSKASHVLLAYSLAFIDLDKQLEHNLVDVAMQDETIDRGWL